MKLDEKSKEPIYILLIFIIVGGTLISMFFPEYIKLPHSVVTVNEITDEVKEIENTLIRNEEEIESLIAKRNRHIENIENSKAEAKEYKDNFDEKTLNYHLPSMLVTLEQGATNLQIGDSQFFIEYDKINEEKSVSETPDLEASEKPDIEESEKPDVEESKEEPGQRTGDEDPKEAKTIQSAPQIEGVSVMTIPLKIINISYSQARAYVEFLENLDFVEPSFVDLYAEQDKISLIVLVNVFHTEKEGAR